MGSDAFYWEDLLDDLISRRNVVPVLGVDLLEVPQPEGAVPFYRLLARRLGEKLRGTGLRDLPATDDFRATSDAQRPAAKDLRGCGAQRPFSLGGR